MMLSVFGLNHKTAPLSVRERFYLQPLEQELLLAELKLCAAVREGFVLSTCNRTEIYTAGDDAYEALHARQWLSRIKRIPLDDFQHEWFYHLRGRDMVEHLFTVACGLDSLVLGELQILHQLKNAFRRAQERGLFGPIFHIMSQMALRTGKKARHETAISRGGASIAWAAVVALEKLLQGLAGRNILVIGAGEMGESTLPMLRQRRVNRLFIMNRTRATAEQLGRRHHAQPAAFHEWQEVVADCDGIICTCGAPHIILEAEPLRRIQQTLRNNRPLVMIDISVPRNIDPAARTIPGVTMTDLDDLQQKIEDNMRKRQEEVDEVHRIVAAKVEGFFDKLAKREKFARLHDSTSSV